MAKKEKQEKPKKFKFRGGEITGYDHRVPENGEQFLKIHYRADFTDTLCAAMGWDLLPETFKTGDIKVTLHAVSMAVQPSSVEFREKYGFEYIAKSIGPFKVTGIKTGEDTADEMIISFDTVCVASDATLKKISAWCSKIGREKVILDGSYVEKQATLAELDETQQNLLGDEEISDGEAAIQ